jgi:hypothetical protein
MTVPASNSHQSDSHSKRLFPESQLGQHFTKYFHHGWGFIEAPAPEEGQPVQWRTETRYPLEPRNLWGIYQNESILLGLSFDSETNYLLLDLDFKGKNHPDKNPDRYKGILEAMEGIGLCRPVEVRSSESKGIHIYYFLPWAVHSFTVATAVKRAINKAGYQLRDGHLETFPNPKHFDAEKVTSFKAHRLPLQEGSYLLDQDLQPITKSIGTLLDWADHSAKGQDMEALTVAMDEAKEYIRKQKYYERGRNSAEKYAYDLQEVINQGWTGYGQTNDYLLTLAKYGIIFLHHTGEDLVQYMLNACLNAPGFRQWCRHQHEIEKRVRQRARSSQTFPYYPYTGNPSRKKTYKEHFYGQVGEDGVIILHPSKKRQQDTIERIKAVIEMLKGVGAFPETVHKRTEAIIAKSKEAFNIGVSQSTLRKIEYKYLWHPVYEVAQAVDKVLEENGEPGEKEEAVNTDSVLEKDPTEQPVNAYSTVGKYPILVDPWSEAERYPKVSKAKGLEDLQVLLHNEGYFLLSPAKQVGENENGISYKTERSEGEIIGQELNSQNPSLDRVSLILHFSIIQQILSTTTNFNSLDSLINETDSNSCIQELINYSQQLIDKGFLYSTSGAATAKKWTFAYKIILLFLTIVRSSECKGEKLSESDTLPQPPDNTSNGRASLNGNGFNHNGFKPVTPTPNSPPSAPQEQVPPENNYSPTPAFTPEQYRQAIRFRLHALPQAKHQVRTFCNLEGLILMPKERGNLEQLVMHQLMLRSPSPILQNEALIWLTAHEEEISQIKTYLGVLWEYFENLAVPNF